MQKTISAGDKDFPRIFETMIILSCYLMPKYYRDENRKEYVTKHFPEVGSREFETVVEQFSEKFLDVVYD